jgi:RNA polymerase sigma-70 factor (ECF subfamily)
LKNQRIWRLSWHSPPFANLSGPSRIEILMMLLAQQDVVPTRAEFHRAIASRGDHWYSACLRITRNADLAADAVQDALLSAWQKRHQFERSAKLETWIHRIAVNAALQLIRRPVNRDHEELNDEMPDDGHTPESEHADHEVKLELSTAFEQLTEIERTCFVLKHMEQWRLNEIATELDTSIGTIKQALFRAVKKLRVTMADRRSNDDE